MIVPVDTQALFYSPYWLLFLSLLVFQGSVWLQAKTGLIFINPTLIAMLVVIGYLLTTNTPYSQFEAASQFVMFWLQPAVVCLAIPLYVQWQKIKSQWLAIIVSQLVGSVVGIVSGVWFVKWLGGSETAMLSVVAKSVTTPIAIEVTQNIGGVVGIATGTVLVSGVVGQIMGLAFLKLARLKRPMAQGLAMGTASHGLGIASIMPMGSRYVAYGTVGLVVNGVLTAFLAPLLLPFIL